MQLSDEGEREGIGGVTVSGNLGAYDGKSSIRGEMCL